MGRVDSEFRACFKCKERMNGSLPARSTHAMRIKPYRALNVDDHRTAFSLFGRYVILMTWQSSDIVTSFFKYNSSITIKSLRLLKMAWFS